MLKERLQILLTTDQRRRLNEEAARREVSVGEVVREALDQKLPGVSREEKLEAFERIKAVEPGPFYSPEEINRMVAEEREQLLSDPGRAASGEQ